MSDTGHDPSVCTALAARALGAVARHGIGAAGRAARRAERWLTRPPGEPPHGTPFESPHHEPDNAWDALEPPLEEPDDMAALVALQAPQGAWPGPGPICATSRALIALARAPVAPRLFADDADEEAFWRDGYLLSKHSLNTSELDVLRSAHEAYPPRGLDGMFQVSAQCHAGDPVTRRALERMLRGALARVVAEALPSYRVLFSAYAAKPPRSPASLMPLHRDPSMVDERHAHSIGCWIPICDVSPANGCLQVVPGSHLLDLQPRAAGVHTPWQALEPALMASHAVDLPMRAGQVLFLDHRLFHASPPNLSDRLRLSLAAALVGPDAMLRCYFATADSTLGVWAVDDDFYTTYTIGTRPCDGPPLTTLALRALPPPRLSRFEEGRLVCLPSLRPFEPGA